MLYQEYSAGNSSENAGVKVSNMDINDTYINAVKNSIKGSLIDLRYIDKIKREK
ncbi:MAG: hypothetical protein HOP31_05445, partial [Ignavibacteria bacterium]|nr:hypothetical protein [Ignavibacteria bacterium]